MDSISIILSIVSIFIPFCLGLVSWRNHKNAQKALKAFEDIKKNNEAEFLKKKNALKYR